MAEKYVVDVAAPASPDKDRIGGQLAGILGIDRQKVDSLISRLPDVVTRPISHAEAEAVVDRFSRAGLRARIRSVSREATPTLFDLSTATPVIESASGTQLKDPTGFSEDDDDFILDEDPADLPPAANLSPLISDLPEDEPGYGEPDAPARDEPAPLFGSPRDGDQEDHAESLSATQTGSEPKGPEFQTFEEITPAELQARLRGGGEPTSVMPAAAAPSPQAAETKGAGKRPARERRRRGGRQAEAAVAAAPDERTALARGSAPAAAGRPDEAAAVHSGARTRKRRGSLQSKLLSTAIIPVLLTIIGALVATWLTARPALYNQLLDSARNPAIATAASLSSAFEQTASAGGIDYLQLQSTILITRQSFPREDIAFIIATDTLGNPLPGFFVGAASLSSSTLDLQDAIRNRALEAVSFGAAGAAGRADAGTSSQLPAGDGSNIEIVAQPLTVGGEPVGAIVVGVSDRAVTAQVNRIILNVLLFSLVPLLLAILIAVWRARRLTGNVLQLTARADQISRGELEEQVEFQSNDELDDLAAALERMRVSMRGAMERLRRRR